MNKKTNILKDILLVINLLAYIYLLKKTGIYGLNSIVYFLSLLFMTYISYKDLKNNIYNSSKYNILFCLVEILVIFLLGRSIFDSSFIMVQENNYIFEDYVQLFYFLQNFYYIMFMYLCLYIYHKIECIGIEYKKSKFSNVILFCLLINLVLVIPTLECFQLEYNLIKITLFILSELTLLTIEIYSLIKNNGKKYEFPIYICFLFNIMAIISIFINIFMY